MLKKSVSHFLIPTTVKFCVLSYHIMKDASKQKAAHTTDYTVYNCKHYQVTDSWER